MSGSHNSVQYPELETERTNMRILALSDTEAVFRHFSDKAITRWMDVGVCKSMDEARAIISYHLKQTGCRWGIFDKGTDQLVGTCGYHRWDQDNSSAEIGYDLSKALWGKGLMQEVLRVVISFGFDEMKLITVTAECNPENLQSIRLLKKLGFQFHKRLKNKQQRFQLLQTDWKSSY